MRTVRNRKRKSKVQTGGGMSRGSRRGGRSRRVQEKVEREGVIGGLYREGGIKGLNPPNIK
jgi:hypothetical protein